MDNNIYTKKVDVSELMFNFQRTSFVDEIADYYKQGLIEKDLYVLLTQSALAPKLKMYQLSRSGTIFRLINRILRSYYKLQYKMLEPVLNSQEKVNKQLVLEIIKLKLGKHSKN
jgi:hypothetical protein